MSHYNTVALFAAVWLKIMHSALFLQGWMEESFLKQLQFLCAGSDALYHHSDTSFICHWSCTVSHYHRYVLPRGSRAKSLNRTKWFCDQWNLRAGAAVRREFPRVLYNIDSSLERTLCDHRGMDRQGQKLEHCPEVTHRHVYHNTNTRLGYLS